MLLLPRGEQQVALSVREELSCFAAVNGQKNVRGDHLVR